MTKRSPTAYKYTHDVLASLVVFFIAIPLSLGIALASGTPPVAAIVAAIVGGIVVGLISGSPLVVTGPAAGLSAMILQFVQSYGVGRLFQITVLAGIIQLCLAAARSGQLIQKVPKTVLEGVLSAIGLIIIIGQLHILLGQKIPGGPVLNILQLPLAISGLFDRTMNSEMIAALASGSFTLLILLSWKKMAGRFEWIPAALPAVVVTTLLSSQFNMPRLAISPIGSYVGESFSQALTPHFWNSMLYFFQPALALAVVASAESLLTIKSINILAAKRHITTKLELNRELMAQGVGNIVSGFLGGLPLSGVMIRSAANLDAGARSRLATIFHSIWIAGFILLAPNLLQQVPLSALSAILIVTGVKLLNLPHMLQAVTSNPKDTWIWPATAIAIVGTDLLTGLAVGLGFALIQFGFQKNRKHLS